MKSIIQVKLVEKCIKTWRSRFILNKQAVLLLFLFSLFSMSLECLLHIQKLRKFAPSILLIQLNISYYKVYSHLFFILSGLLSAWLAGWKYRLVDIVFIGMIITGVACLVGAISGILASASIGCGTVCTTVLINIFWILLNTGLAPVIANIFQLVVEQIPGASSSQLSSLVSWFVFSKHLGYWLSEILIGVFHRCIGRDGKSYLQYSPYFIFVSGAIYATVLSMYSLLKYKLVDYLPTSNTVSHIYQVVKYAIKHRRPVQRSAMTYWEEKIPKGMDLSKRKYGGSFSSEQVEDVKTFFRLLQLFVLALFYLCTFELSGFSLHDFIEDERTFNYSIYWVEEFDSKCTQSTMYNIFNINLWILLSIIVYEFFMMPMLHYRVPNIRWRLRLSFSLGFLLCLVITIINGIDTYSTVTYRIDKFWFKTGQSISAGIVGTIYFVSMTEFILAQTPYAMRNFFFNIYFCISFLALTFSRYIFQLFDSQCTSRNCPMIYSLVISSLNFVAMLLFWIAITRYRMRSRGQDDEHQQRWIEEVYDRYLEDVKD